MEIRICHRSFKYVNQNILTTLKKPGSEEPNRTRSEKIVSNPNQN